MSLGETSRRRAHDSIAHSDSGKERRRAHSRVSQAHRAVTDSVALCSIFNSTNRIEPVFLAPFRLYCKLVRRPGQGCSSAPWAPCRMQHSYRSFTVHHGVWFLDSTRMQRRRAHCSVDGPVPEAPFVPYFYHLLVTDSTIFHTLKMIACKLGGDGLTDTGT